MSAGKLSFRELDALAMSPSEADEILVAMTLARERKAEAAEMVSRAEAEPETESGGGQTRGRLSVRDEGKGRRAKKARWNRAEDPDSGEVAAPVRSFESSPERTRETKQPATAQGVLKGGIPHIKTFPRCVARIIGAFMWSNVDAAAPTAKPKVAHAGDQTRGGPVGAAARSP